MFYIWQFCAERSRSCYRPCFWVSDSPFLWAKICVDMVMGDVRGWRCALHRLFGIGVCCADVMCCAGRGSACVGVTHKEVKRGAAGRRPGEEEEKNTTHSSAKVTHLHSYTQTDTHTHRLLHCQRWVSTEVPTIKASEWHQQPQAMAEGQGQPVAAGQARMGTARGAKSHNLSRRGDSRLAHAAMGV